MPPVTMAEGEGMLRRDLERFARSVHRRCPVPLTRGQYDALVSRLTLAALVSARCVKSWRTVIMKVQLTSFRDGCLPEGDA